MLYSLLRTYLRPYRAELAGVIALQLISTMASLYLPTLNARIIDDGVTKGDTSVVLSTGGVMLLITGLQIVCSIGAVYFGARAAIGLGRDLRRAVMYRVGDFSSREVGLFGAPSLITRNTNDVQQIQMVVVISCTILVAAPIMCIGGVVMSIEQSQGLAWVLAVAVPVLALTMFLVVRKMVPEFRSMQVRIDAINRVLREQITGIRVVRAFVRERDEVQRFGETNDSLVSVALRVGRLMAFMSPAVLMIANLTSISVLWLGAHLIDQGKMEIGALTAVLTYIMQILMSVMMVTVMTVLLPRASVCAERISEVLDTEPSVSEPDRELETWRARGIVEMRNVSFSFQGADEPVLRDISFLAEPGMTTAIIGGTGAGKSTLLNLIPRLIDATAGQVRVGAADVRRLDATRLRSSIGLIPQKPFLFSGTIATNLRYGNPDATDAELWRSLEVAQAADFVKAAPTGLDTPIAQGGANLSGGQRQRIAIARALVRNAEIYLFDDSFSALDLGTDARLRAALKPVTRDACVIVVAQRVSTIIDADQIIVLDDGRVVGIGTHHRLLETCPTYAEIVASQFTAQEAS
ncbi:ABC transporter ATP-binding protein [Rhodococcus sp. Q]|uniref:ABC transporter ATP-binding protein n=1 Tax=Rhodococcus sp. Q TaxID=2502252 RepID=UPI0010F58246|nr:ABC transporter ATP-binding protein [Rhodococcus sp. Q]